MELVDCGLKPHIVDVGHTGGPSTVIQGDLFHHRRSHDCFDLMIGDRYEGLSNLLSDRQVPVKLTAPYLDYVTRDAERLSPLDEVEFHAIQSFSLGGLANAWGAGLYRFTDDDLEAFPITSGDLDPYFDKLTAAIGIAGTEDDLSPFLGSTEQLQPPLRLSRNVGALYERYQRKGRRVADSIHIGRARVGVLTEARDGRPAFEYGGAEFFQEDRSIYSPRYTLDQLVQAGKVVLHRGVLVESWDEGQNGGITVFARDLAAQTGTTFEARKLVLATGAINTSKIVLQSHGDYDTSLPLLENPALQVPLVLPRALGHRLETDAFGLVQLNLIWDSKDYAARLQGSIMEITAPMRAEFFAGLPYAARANLALLRYLLPAMIVMQLFFPRSSQEPAQLGLQRSGRLTIRGRPNTIDLRKLQFLLRYLRKLGAWTLSRLIVRVPTGHAVHYAGSLPMRETPVRYQCDVAGRLHGTTNVFVADSASFSDLPAKNMSFAMMANAMRIAHGVAAQLKRS
jgi:choline dehydrogenase-like flavoprotein